MYSSIMCVIGLHRWQVEHFYFCFVDTLSEVNCEVIPVRSRCVITKGLGYCM